MTQYIAPERHTKPSGNGWTGEDHHWLSRPITVKIRGNSKTAGNITDTVYGCSGNCPMECYAERSSYKLGITKAGWKVPVSQILDVPIFKRTLAKCPHPYIRFGTMGEPCFNIELLIDTCQIVHEGRKLPLVMTRWWIIPTYKQLKALVDCNTHIHCSITPFDTEKHLSKMFELHNLYTELGGTWTWRVVTFDFNKELQRGLELWAVQDTLMAMPDTMEQPARIFTTNPRFHLMNKSTYKKYYDTNNISAGCLYPDHHSCYVKYCYECDHQCMTFPKSYNWVQTQIDTFKNENKKISKDCQQLIEILEDKNDDN